MNGGSRCVLVRGPNWLGDLVMATPAFRALRAALPEAHLALHLRAELLPLLGGAPWFDEVLPLASYHRGPGALLAEGLRLRARRFELGVCLPDSTSSALLMRAAGVGQIVGYRRGGRRPLLHLAVPPPRQAGRRLRIARERHALGLVEALGCEPLGTRLELFTTPREEELADEKLGADASAPLAVLAPGASFGPSKLWPPRYFARVGDALAAAGARVALVGTPAERALCAQLREAMREPALDLSGELGLGALKAVLRRARVLVCNDAGARHVAVAFGVPTVVLFGPTSLEKTNLNLERVRVLDADVGCRPCYHRVCPIDHRCMTRLDPARVIEAALPALAADAPRSFRGDAGRRAVSDAESGI